MPAPDAVERALDRLAEARAELSSAWPSWVTTTMPIEKAARTQHAALVKALEAANALLGRIADEAASTQNTARRTEGLMPLIDCRLIADVFRYVGACKVQP